MPRPFSENANYRSEIRAILHLHRLWQIGKGESDEADAFRDATDGFWEQLNQTERQRIHGLSEDLNAASEHGSNVPSTPMSPQAQAKLVEASEARQRGEWDHALEILRSNQDSIAPALLCYLRGAVWSEAGDPEVAAVFFKHAARLEPGNKAYHALSIAPAPLPMPVANQPS